MTDEELQEIVESVSLGEFGKPFIYVARFNKKLRTTGGRYMLANHSIEINPLVLDAYGTDELIGIIKHELCHYHLHIEGKGYRHGDADFKNLLKLTSSPRYCQTLLKGNKQVNWLHEYECTLCRLIYKRKRRMDVGKYRCGECAGRIKEIQHIN